MSEHAQSDGRRSTLSPAKRALLEKRLRGLEKTAESGLLPAISPRPAGEPARLSFAQERLWFLDRLNPASRAYNMHHALRVRGPLDLARLEKSVNEVIVRPEILHTRVVSTAAGPVQEILPALHLPLELEDLTPLDQDERSLRVAELAAAAARRPFDLEKPPLLHLTALRLAPAEHVLLLTVHHIISDEWSDGVFWRELAAFYAAPAAGSEPSLPELPIQYADFARWQKDQLSEAVRLRQLAYWKEQLAGDLPLLQLPFDHPRPAAQSFRGGLRRRQLPPTLAAALRELSQARGATMFMTLLAAFMTFLIRFSGQEEVLVGIPIANRSRPEIENLIGFFLNTLVLRADGGDDPAFVEFLARVARTALDGYANQDLPFEKLVDELRPERDLSYNPLFQVMFVYQENPGEIFRLPGLDLSPLPVDGGVSKFDLTLFATESAAGLEIALEYSSDLFDMETIDRWLGHFHTLLQGVVAAPETPLSQLPLLRADERRRLLVEWNGTGREFPRQAVIHDLIAAWAEKTPDAPAVYYEEERLTYRQLNEQANRLAHFLRRLGAGRGSRIGLCLERGPEMITAILAVLKAGGAYIPLDPAYPAERLATMLGDARTALLITHGDLPTILGQIDGGPPVVYLDRDRAEIAACSSANPEPLATPDTPAYIIYTSGSTGRPKGVEVTHRSLVHSTTARFAVYDEPFDNFLLLSSFAFDSSLVGIFWSLTAGAGLTLTPPRFEQDVAAIAGLIERRRITHLLCLPALYGLILEYGAAAQLGSLTCVIVAGESCPAGLSAAHFRRLPGTALYNEYGPTEGTVWSTVYRFSPAETIFPVPIGRPIPNMRAYILDRQRQPVPVGVAGELTIAGEGIARGYFNRPALTAERFVECELDDQLPPERVYLTGDLVRYLPDGRIQFLGRVDDQVKIRGYRVELGEIEAVLGTFPGLQEGVVLLRQNERGAGGPADDVAVLAERLARLEDGLRETLLAEIEAAAAADRES